jgi:hypothetical protein
LQSLGGNPLVTGPLGDIDQCHWEGQGSDGSLRPPPLKEARAEKIGWGFFLSGHERSSGGRRTRADGAKRRTHSGGEPTSRSARFRRPSLPRRRPRIGAQRRPLINPAAFHTDPSRHEHAFDAPDQDRLGAVRKAHCRWYLCTNGSVTGKVRFFYWHDDASWAVPTWRTIIGTVRLGSLPLASPFDHWSLKAPD